MRKERKERNTNRPVLTTTEKGVLNCLKNGINMLRELARVVNGFPIRKLKATTALLRTWNKLISIYYFLTTIESKL